MTSKSVDNIALQPPAQRNTNQDVSVVYQDLEIDDTGVVSEEPRALDKSTLLKLSSAAFSFFVAGVNDGSIGALIPHILRSYGITTAIVSALYAASFLGWFSAAASNTHLAQKLDLGAMLLLGAALQTVAQVLRAWPTPPFGLFICTFWMASLGQAYQDTHANTFVASRKDTAVHRWLGMIHAAYMAGCLVAPFAASPIASSSSGGDQERLYLFYTVPLVLGVVNLALVLLAFRDTIRFVPTPESSHETSSSGPRVKTPWELAKEALCTKSVWLLSLFFFFYLGATVTAGGWVVEYLVDVRHGELAKMGYVPAGFSGGCLLGRLILPEPTHRFGERPMVFLYCVLCLGFQLLFWLVPNIIAASVAISFLGFFLGPFFATAISVGARIFPADISSTAISFVFVNAQIGGSLFPIVTGVLGSTMGVSVMQPILVALITATGLSWLVVPQALKKQE
ncbi:major facilitator superfamily domain-containing protein [Podospora australis]|uniref:Major facilitator superfamily domain-containing protein n=1 Tax=Podospora australis TaxID=1536484 RepID=A0AAN6WJ86_9PEZI|nr:major facilitator superfamily domain-containing protein [Podospora australis]